MKTTSKRGPGRMRHLQVEELWLQDEVRQGRVEIKHISTSANTAYLFTKHLPRRRLESLVEMIGMRDGGE
eukprot:4950184-Heterocapsa_arctica.AAC.1